MIDINIPPVLAWIVSVVIIIACLVEVCKFIFLIAAAYVDRRDKREERHNESFECFAALMKDVESKPEGENKRDVVARLNRIDEERRNDAVNNAMVVPKYVVIGKWFDDEQDKNVNVMSYYFKYREKGYPYMGCFQGIYIWFIAENLGIDFIGASGGLGRWIELYESGKPRFIRVPFSEYNAKLGSVSKANIIGDLKKGGIKYEH